MMTLPIDRMLLKHPSKEEFYKNFFVIREGDEIEISDSGPFYTIHEPPIEVNYKKWMGMPTLSDNFVKKLKAKGYKGFCYKEILDGRGLYAESV